MKTAKELESRVWEACDIMRSAGLTTLQYIEQLTDFLYLKILDDAEVEEELKYEIAHKGNYKTRLGNDEYRFYNWSESQPDKVKFLDNLYNVLRDIGNHNGHDNSGIRRIFKRSNLLIRDNAKLERVIQIVKDIELNDYDFDVKGAIYEFILSKMSEAGQLGQFFTPRHIVDMMIKIAHPQIGEYIYDPSSGTGGFLTRIFSKIREDLLEKHPGDEDKWKFMKEEQFTGRDISEVTSKLCIMNMMLHGDGHTKIIYGDSLSYAANQIDQHNKFDVIHTNPPFGSTVTISEDMYKFPIKSSNPENLFLQHIIISLKNGGRAAVVVPEGILFRNQDKRLREYLIENCRVDAVISLPAGVFQPYTGVKTDILFFTKGEPTEKVWFYNLENDGFDLSANRRYNGKSDIQDLLQKIKTFEESENSWIVTIDEIKNSDYSLKAGRYRLNSIYVSTCYQTKKLGDITSINTGKLDVNAKTENGQYPFFTCAEEISYINEYAFEGKSILLSDRLFVSNLDKINCRENKKKKAGTYDLHKLKFRIA